MAAAARIVSLNLGSQRLSLALFQPQAQGGLVLEDFRQREILADPATEADRQARWSLALREMMSELGLGDGAVNYAVSGQSVFARFVKLPAVDEEKIERIITFEAQQNVPFPIEEVVWDYQLVGSTMEEKIEVVLVAIKAELLEEINATVEATGLQTTLVDVATMALYNAFRFNYSDLSGCSLVIDIGARTTNLLFVEPGKVFSRSIPIGGSSITSAIAKEFNEPFAAAELRKTRDGFVSLGGAYAEASDPEVARVSKLVRNTMTRLHADLARSTSFYRSQQQGTAPERVFLCGGAASMAYTREFFREKLQLPIEFLNPLRNVAVAEPVALEDVAHSAHLLGEVVGLALRNTSTCPMELNLRPASVVRRQQLVERRPFLLVAAACFLLGLVGCGFYFLRAAQVEAATSDRLQTEVDRMHDFENRLTIARRETAKLDDVAAPLLDEIGGRGAWLQIVDDLNARLPKENIWITELSPMSGSHVLSETSLSATPTPAPAATAVRGRGAAPSATPSRPMIDGVFVRGLYLFNPKQQEVVTDYFRNLLGSEVFEVDANEQSKVIKPSTPTAAEWAYPYELRLKLRAPLPLP
ncbi:MAG TPA: type IV pilus assembly protein PilM [Chthoniobacterales bacterium]|nr:type IV pilus assembly protein PilM [Chthoniobacterales bacterium]